MHTPRRLSHWLNVLILVPLSLTLMPVRAAPAQESAISLGMEEALVASHHLTLVALPGWWTAMAEGGGSQNNSSHTLIDWAANVPHPVACGEGWTQDQLHSLVLEPSAAMARVTEGIVRSEVITCNNWNHEPSLVEGKPEMHPLHIDWGCNLAFNDGTPGLSTCRGDRVDYGDGYWGRYLPLRFSFPVSGTWSSVAFQCWYQREGWGADGGLEGLPWYRHLWREPDDGWWLSKDQFGLGSDPEIESGAVYTASDSGSCLWGGGGCPFSGTLYLDVYQRLTDYGWQSQYYSGGEFRALCYLYLDRVPKVVGLPYVPEDQTWAPCECPFGCSTHSQGWEGGPINTRTGNVHYSRQDLSIPALGSPLRFERSYNSQSVTGTVVYSQPLGHGWTHNYDVDLTFSDDPGGEEDTVIVKGCHGFRFRFRDHEDGTYAPFLGVWPTLTRTLTSPYTSLTFRTSGSASITFTYGCSRWRQMLYSLLITASNQRLTGGVLCKTSCPFAKQPFGYVWQVKASRVSAAP